MPLSHQRFSKRAQKFLILFGNVTCENAWILLDFSNYVLEHNLFKPIHNLHSFLRVSKIILFYDFLNVPFNKLSLPNCLGLLFWLKQKDFYFQINLLRNKILKKHPLCTSTWRRRVASLAAKCSSNQSPAEQIHNGDFVINITFRIDFATIKGNYIFLKTTLLEEPYHQNYKGLSYV